MGYAGGRLGKANLLAGIAGAWTVASLILVVVRGDVSEPWATLDGTQPMVRGVIATCLVGRILL